MDVTHTIDAVRYFCISRQIVSKKPEKEKIIDPFFDEENDKGSDYYEFMTGGELTPSYLNY